MYASEEPIVARGVEADTVRAMRCCGCGRRHLPTVYMSLWYVGKGISCVWTRAALGCGFDSSILSCSF